MINHRETRSRKRHIITQDPPNSVNHKKLYTHVMLKSVLLWFDASQFSLQWCHNGRYIVSNHQPHDSLLNRLFRRRWKKTSELRVTGLCVGNSQVTGEFPAQMASNAENVSIWWRHHVNMEIAPIYKELLLHKNKPMHNRMMWMFYGIYWKHGF